MYWVTNLSNHKTWCIILSDMLSLNIMYRSGKVYSAWDTLFHLYLEENHKKQASLSGCDFLCIFPLCFEIYCQNSNIRWYSFIILSLFIETHTDCRNIYLSYINTIYNIGEFYNYRYPVSILVVKHTHIIVQCNVIRKVMTIWYVIYIICR